MIGFLKTKKASMNILILNWKDVRNPEAGGAEIIAHIFARNLAKEGNNVVMLTRHFKGGTKEETIDGVKILRRGNRITVYFEAYLYYRRLIKKPDLVIDMVNTICWQTSLYVPKKKRILYVNQLAKEVFFYELPWPLSKLCFFLEPMEYKTYKDTKTVCYSKSTRDDLISFGINKKNIHVFPLGLDHKRYKTGEKKSIDPLFIFVARIVKMKKPDLCVKAMANIIKKYPRAKLAIIGNGPYEKDLGRLIVKLNLSDSVSIVNKNNFYVDNKLGDKKVELMQKAWVILLPSVKEGWGMVITEAAACGTPAIVSNVTGLRDSVLKNKTGLVLSKSPSIAELTKAMTMFIEDNGLRTKMSNEAITFSNLFSWEKSYKKFKEIIFSRR